MRTGGPFSGIIISYLGNINGRNPAEENKRAYIEKALAAGWHVCVDVVFHYGTFVLPYNGGFHTMPPAMLSKQRIWCCAHDPVTLDALCNVGAHAFLVSDTPTLTSAQFVWTPAGVELTPRSIACFPEDAPAGWLDSAEPAGLCSNSPALYI